MEQRRRARCRCPLHVLRRRHSRQPEKKKKVIASHHSTYFDHPTSPLRQIIKREALVAPVTAVSIIPECNRVLVCRGSEMESLPLLCVQDEEAGNKQQQEQEPSCPSCPPGASDRGDNQIPSEKNSNNDAIAPIGDQNTYRHRAFAPWDGSGIIHGVRYAKSYHSHDRAHGQQQQQQQHECTSSSSDEAASSRQLLPHWSTLMAVFGGRNLAIVSGGGIGKSASAAAAALLLLLLLTRIRLFLCTLTQRITRLVESATAKKEMMACHNRPAPA